MTYGKIWKSKALRDHTDDELLDRFRLRGISKEEERLIRAEMERRIRSKNAQPHEQNCLCTDCVYQE